MARFRSKTRTRVHGFDGRAVHLIDAENLGGGPDMGIDEIRYMLHFYFQNVPATANDQFYLAGSSHFIKRAITALPDRDVRLLVRDGKDGADHALLDSIDIDHVARQFDRLVIASGDGAFEGLALEARARDLHVQVVCGVGTLSRSLCRAASTVSRLKLRFEDELSHAGTARWQVATRRPRRMASA